MRVTQSLAAVASVVAAAAALTACAVEEQPANEQPGTTAEPTTGPSEAEPTESEADGSGKAADEKVDIVDFVFQPGEITVPVGSTVTWTQQDASLHTVDFDDGEKSGDMPDGDTYSRTFDKPGSYPYICFYHPRMTGTVTVE